jgi:uncharacterized membrane protein YdjX (TVP38/TMEM64 family)
MFTNPEPRQHLPDEGWSVVNGASSRGLSTGVYRLLVLVLVILGLWMISSATGVTARFTAENIRGLLQNQGLWGVVAFTAIFSAGQLLRVPGTLFIAVAVAAYGKSFGTLVALVGAFVSVNVSFVVVRSIAGRPLADVRRPAVRRLLGKIDSRPVTTVALLRLIFQTAPPVNYALAMTAVRWQDHLLGSALGLPLPIAVMALFSEWLLKHLAWLHHIV